MHVRRERFTEHFADTFAHFTRSLIRKCNAKNRGRVNLSVLDKMDYARCQSVGFTSTGTSKDEKWSFAMLDRLELRRIEFHARDKWKPDKHEKNLEKKLQLL
jgi:hypothetical protein